MLDTRDVQAFLNSPSTRELLGVDRHVQNMTMISRDVYWRFWNSGDPMHLTQPYVVELLARGVKVILQSCLSVVECFTNWGC